MPGQQPMSEPAQAGSLPNCRLCGSSQVSWFSRVRGRDFLQCADCALVFVPREQHVSPEQELRRYALHDNSSTNPGYVEYLQAVAREIGGLPIENPRVLDFGSGPGQVLEGILRGLGILCRSYDPLYDIGADCLSEDFDVVVVNEVLEHVRDPRREMLLLRGLLRTDGFALVKTLLCPSADFSGWWYAQDITHVNFFSERTLQYAARLIGGSVWSTDHKHSTVIRRDASDGAG